MDRERDLLRPEDLTYDAAGLIPTVVQDHATGDVLMVAYMNAESLARTLATGKTWFWSRSRQQYWMKGESSGHVQDVHEIRYDCDADCLLVRVTQHGPGACHTNERSCFYRRLYPEPASLAGQTVSEGVIPAGPEPSALGPVLDELAGVLESRAETMPEGSYTAKLLGGPLDALLKKVAEESGEVIMAAKDGDREHLRYEIADLLYHLLVVMVREGITLEDLGAELARRRASSA
jgi:phosphoribosyl-ATP pyrophosphohydrolase/phosphoribosyl-AMP cyclohydrolase